MIHVGHTKVQGFSQEIPRSKVTLLPNIFTYAGDQNEATKTKHWLRRSEGSELALATKNTWMQMVDLLV